MEFYVLRTEERDDPPDIKRREEEDHGGDSMEFDVSKDETVCLQVSWRTSQEVSHGLTGLG